MRGRKWAAVLAESFPRLFEGLRQRDGGLLSPRDRRVQTRGKGHRAAVLTESPFRLFKCAHRAPKLMPLDRPTASLVCDVGSGQLFSRSRARFDCANSVCEETVAAAAFQRPSNDAAKQEHGRCAVAILCKKPFTPPCEIEIRP